MRFYRGRTIYEVAGLDPPEQDRLLQAAIDNFWSTRELREAVKAFKLLQAPEPKPDYQEPPDPPEVAVTTEVEEYEEVGEQIIAGASNLEADFRRLLGICKALLVAERGNLAKGIKPNEEDAGRLWAAAPLRPSLSCLVAQHDGRGEQAER